MGFFLVILIFLVIRGQFNDIKTATGFDKNKVVRIFDRLKELVNSLSMKQCINNSNSFNSFLDLCFSDFDSTESDIFYNLIVKLDLHHFVYNLEFDTTFPTSSQYDFETFNFVKSDYQGLSAAFFQRNWSFSKDMELSLDMKVDKSYSILYESIVCFAPTINLSNPDSPPWFNKELKNAIKLKLYYHRQ